MFKKAWFVAAAMLCLSLAGLALRRAEAQKPLVEPPTMVQFDNGNGNKITSDEASNGPLIDGVGQVEAVINTNTGDFLFNLVRSRRPARHLSFDLGTGPDPVLGIGCPGTVSPIAPNTGVQQYMAFLNVQNVLFVPADGQWYQSWTVNGQAYNTGAVFQTFEPAGNFRFSPEYNRNPGDPCTSRVQVRRALELQSRNEGRPVWEIQAAPLQNDIALQVQSIDRQTKPVGYFRLPFKITVWLL